MALNYLKQRYKYNAVGFYTFTVALTLVTVRISQSEMNWSLMHGDNKRHKF